MDRGLKEENRVIKKKQSELEHCRVMMHFLLANEANNLSQKRLTNSVPILIFVALESFSRVVLQRRSGRKPTQP